MNWKWVIGIGCAGMVTVACAAVAVTFALMTMTAAIYLPVVSQAADDFHSFNQQVVPAVETGKEINSNLAEGVKAIKEWRLWKDQQEGRVKR